MKTVLTAFAAASALMLAACGGDEDDALGERVEDKYENQADQLEAMAENATTEAEEQALENQADAMERMGDQKEEAIDDTDIDADALTEAQKNAIVNSQ